MIATVAARPGWLKPAGLLLLVGMLLSACAGPWGLPSGGHAMEGIASWYGPGFHGRRTANGEVFNQNAHTAAHKTLPFGSRVRVINLENGRSMVVVINDRGPFVRGRVIDVSRRVAERLGFRGKGLARVRLQVVGRGKG